MLSKIKRPIFTEKTMFLFENFNRCIFSVDVNLTKPQIRIIFRRTFLVSNLKINTRTQKYKPSKSNKIKTFKRAYIDISGEDNILFFLGDIKSDKSLGICLFN